MNDQPTINQTTTVVISNKKSMIAAFLLSFLFGPLGLLYATIIGGLLMMFLAIISWFFAPLIGYFLVHIVSVIWSLIAVGLYNGNVSSKVSSLSSNN